MGDLKHLNATLTLERPDSLAVPSGSATYFATGGALTFFNGFKMAYNQETQNGRVK